MVEWDSQETVDRVMPVVQAAHRDMGFSPKETIARLGVTAELGIYQPIERRVRSPPDGTPAGSLRRVEPLPRCGG